MNKLELYNYSNETTRIKKVNDKQNVRVHDFVNYKDKAELIELVTISNIENPKPEPVYNMTRRNRQSLKKRLAKINK